MYYADKLMNWVKETYGEWIDKNFPSHDIDLSETMKFSMYALSGYYESLEMM